VISIRDPSHTMISQVQYRDLRSTVISYYVYYMTKIDRHLPSADSDDDASS